MLRAGEVVSTAAGRRVLTVPGNAYSPNYTLFRERISVQPCSSLLFVYVIHKVVLFPQISTLFENKNEQVCTCAPRIWKAEARQAPYTWCSPGLHIEFQDSHGYLTEPCLKKWGKESGRDGWVVKETRCSCRRPRFRSSSPHEGSEPLIENLMHSSDFLRRQTCCTWYAGKIPTCIK